MMTRNTHAPMKAQAASDVVLEVPREDEIAYVRHSYHDYMHVWNELVCELAKARRTGDTATATRLHDELQHFWPQADEVAHVPWVPEDEWESALPSDEDR